MLVDGVSVGVVDSYKFKNVKDSHKISASFGNGTLTITPRAGANGAISPHTAQSLGYGSDSLFVITPHTGYHIDDVLVDGHSIGASGSVLFTNVTSSHDVSATFAIDRFTITPVAGANGSVSAPQTLDYGTDSAPVTIAAAYGYRIASVLLDGQSIGASSSVTLQAVTGDHTISASFTRVTFVSKITVPAVSGTLKANKYVTVAGKLTPTHKATVVLQFWQIVKKKPVLKKTVRVTAAGGKWTIKWKFARGPWKIRAQALSATASEGIYSATSWTGYKAMTIK